MVREEKIIVVLGPTASGKTRFAASLAYELDTEIISADSRQVYRDMNIGTGKDYPEYVVNGKPIPVNLIDIVNAGFEYDLSQFIRDFNKEYKRIISKDKVPILCGGSGLYIEAVLKGYELPSIPINNELRSELEIKDHEWLKNEYLKLPPHAHSESVDLSTKKRTIRAIEISKYLMNYKLDSPKHRVPIPLIFGLNPPIEMRRRLIEKRLISRIEDGLIQEVESLLKNIPSEKLIRYGLEYKFATEYLLGKLSKEELMIQLTIAIQQFAKRQMTYFRKMEKAGLKIHWIGSDEFEIVKKKSLDFIK